MATPSTSESAYSTPALFCNDFDVRSIGDILSDNTSTGRLTPAQVVVSPILEQLLQEASGDVESECMRGQIYSPSDLMGLTGNSAMLLARIVNGVAAMFLWERRVNRTIPAPPIAMWAAQKMNRLGNGQAVFGILENQQSGVPKPYSETAQDVYNRRMVTTQARRLFGPRSNTVPYPDQG